MKQSTIALGFALAFLAPIAAHGAPQAAETANDGKVLFWQTGRSSGGKSGSCVVDFGFNGGALKEAIENLVLKIRVVGGDGTDFGTQDLALGAPLGGDAVDSSAGGVAFSLENWPHRDDGALSPLCDKRVRLVVEGATGTQAGKSVDLVKFGQLQFTAFQRIEVSVAADQLSGVRPPDTTTRRRESPPPAPGVRQPQESQMRYLNGVILYQKGNYLGAQKEWNAALQLDPENDDARAGLQKLEKLLSGAR